MAIHDSEFYIPRKQRGGAFQVNGFVALALLASAVGGAFYGYYQHAHRTIELHITLPATTIRAPSVTVSDEDDAYVTHAFPRDNSGSVCTFVNTICYITI